MATLRSTLKTYFLTGKKPTQSQFAALIDSFLHLTEDSLSITQIQNLQNVLAGKASTAQIGALVQGKQDKLNQRISGCEITPGPATSIASGSWEINGILYSKPTSLTFTNINLCANGLLKSVAFYGNTLIGIDKVESGESAAVLPPSNEIANKALLRWMIVSDATYQNQPVNYEKFTNIALNAYGTHPAFTSQHQLNIWLLSNVAVNTATLIFESGVYESGIYE